jgi:hypothetical protein
LEEKHLEYDYAVAEEKRNEMEELVKNTILNNTTADLKKASCFDIQKMSSEITDSLIEITSNEYEYSICPIQITPPECEVSSRRVITVQDDFTGGVKSTKLGNIKLDLKKLCILSSESIFQIVAATHMPWLIPFAAIVICNKFWSLQNIQITERDSAVIWTMWKNRDPEDCIKAKIILDLVNTELLNCARPPMSQKELEMRIKNLEKIKFIEKVEENTLRLIEEVKVTY